jgi:hypothetical protein
MGGSTKPWSRQYWRASINAVPMARNLLDSRLAADLGPAGRAAANSTSDGNRTRQCHFLKCE